jgi:hypothetical protein
MSSLNIPPTQRVTPKTQRICSTSHVEQSYATRLSKSFFLVKILPVEIDDFCPNLAGVAHIWPQGFIGSLRVKAK